MSSFISSSMQNGREIATIDGTAANATKTLLEGNTVVKLSSARQEESGFNWLGRKISEVTMSRVLIYDDLDVDCLCWFIISGIKLDLSHLFVSPVALNSLNSLLDNLKERNIKVVEGSTITLPIVSGGMGYGSCVVAEMKCTSIGFKVNMGYGFF